MNLFRSIPQARSTGLSTRTHLVLLVLALLVPVLAFAAVLANRYATAERARFEQEALGTARHIAGLVERDVAGLQAALQTLSTSSRLQARDYEAFYSQAMRVKSFVGENIVVRDPSGQQLVSTRAPWGTPLPRTPLDGDAEAIESRRPAATGVFTGAVAGVPLFAVIVPVLDDGEVTHLLSLSPATERLLPLLRGGLDPGWTSGVVDRGGVLLARSERHNEVTGRPAPADFVGSARQEGVWTGTDIFGVPVLSAYVRLPSTGWIVWASVPQAATAAPLGESLWALAALGAGFVGLSLFMAYSVGSRIAGSIRGLAASAASLGRGETVLPRPGSLREANEVMRALSAASIGLRERKLERDHAEAAMRAGEARFRQLAEALPQLVWIMQPDGVGLYCNQRCLDFYGSAWSQLTGRLSHIHPDDRDKAATLRTESVAAGRLFQVVVRLRSVEEPYRWHILSIVPLKGKDGAWVGTATDIDDLRRAEEVNARLAAIVTASADAIISCSADGRIRSWNPAAERLFGYSAEEAIGAPAGLLVPSDGTEGTHGTFGQAILGETVKADVVRVAKGGDRIDIAVTAAPIRAADGEIVGVSAAMRDIREAKRGEAALRESERRLDAVLNNASVSIFLMDDRQQCVYMNAAAERLTGYALSETQGRPLHDVIHHTRPDGSPFPLEECPIDRAFPKNNREQGEDVFVHKDGRFYSVGFTASPIRDENAEVVGTIVEVRDISAKKAFERRQQLLINELNHRVKNTLATVQGIAAQTLRSSATDVGARAAFEARLLALSKVHNVLTRQNWEAVSLADIAAEVLAPHGGEDRTRIAVDGAELRVHPRMALPLAMALHELATNAVKYGPLSNASGRVSIEWRVDRAPDGRRLHLRWAEEGGPPVTPPSRKGFGSRLIERSLALELGGKVSLDYAATGVVCTIEALLAEDADPSPEEDIDRPNPARPPRAAMH